MSLNDSELNKSVIYIAATPIGDPEDISLRVIRVLRDADLVIGEERKIVSRFLRSLELKKEIFLVNEHSTEEDIKSLVLDLVLNPKRVVFVSDCGTPGFEDPGVEFVRVCREYGLRVIPLPGASSLMTLLMVSGISMKKFYYGGFLSPKREIRQNELKNLAIRYAKEPVVLMDTPYRLQALLEDMKRYFSPEREIILGYKLTMPEERIIQFRLKDYKNETEKLPKGEFVLIIR